LEDNILRAGRFERRQIAEASSQLTMRLSLSWREMERVIDGLLGVLLSEDYIEQRGEASFTVTHKVLREIRYMPGYFRHGFVGYEIVERSQRPTIVAPVLIPKRPQSLPFGEFIAKRYRILDSIGSGGMCEVYQAEDLEQHRIVAVKLLHAHLTGEKGSVERFRREALSLLNLEHPNVVKVFDVGETEDGRAYLVMEWIDGGSLEDAIAEAAGPLGLPFILNVAIQICEALQYVHDHGIVHRDLKPSNVLLTKERDRAVLSDFGIARIGVRSGLTLPSSFIGTPEYVSPEQAQGMDVDCRSDLYCLGIVLFEMASGQRPFDGDEPLSIAYKQVYKRPPALGENVPVELQQVIYRLLEKSPDDRYQSAREVMLALREIEQSWSETLTISPNQGSQDDH